MQTLKSSTRMIFLIFLSVLVNTAKAQFRGCGDPVCEEPRDPCLTPPRLPFCDNKMVIYPNPSNGNVTISFDKEEDSSRVQIILFDASFRRISSTEINPEQQDRKLKVPLSVSDREKGIYYINVRQGRSSQTVSFSKY